MDKNSPTSLKLTSHDIGRWLLQASDRIATWVTQLSWWKFFLFGILFLIAGAIVDSTLFTSSTKSVVVKTGASHKDIAKAIERERSISIDDNGVRIGKPGSPGGISIDDSGVHVGMAPPPSDASASADASVPPAPPAPPSVKEASPDESNADEDVISKVADAKAKIADAKEKMAEAKSKLTGEDDDGPEFSYHIQSSNWFMNFIWLLLLALFGTKLLMGGKKRAEVKAQVATAAAEHANLQREVSEAKMQMMQAQVEPHFLFNTLASVAHLIETDPPRAFKMQNRLIQYLRAVLPQMRETATITNLGREADIAKAYLDLLKMRMEERLIVDFAVPDGLRSAAFPPMMLQSLVENAIKHGLECKPEGGTLRVFAEVSHNKLRVSVADNGMGFGVVPSNSTGLGLQSIRDRLKLLHGDLAQLIITPNSPSGVCACIEVPYQLATASNGNGNGQTSGN
ncbi:sensor histidine kinase [Glaciimonas soli]|uniref:Sensor histidine kinase n=1 Tax=Glaciimonas soli TaxID=2590999 RepID=A0A843YIH3_9BURK|nr:histidine kinase [Glaciimonas soli]MQQ99568.1 sensor histidine kinase [Glaciimonas soli]